MGDINYETAVALMKIQKYREALSIFEKVLYESPNNWSVLYLAGQCCRYTGDLKKAITYLARASKVKPDEVQILMALGIALQLENSYSESIEALKSAIEIEPDNELAYNSLALTQKKMGKLDIALHSYDAGLKALSRRIVKSFRNIDSSTFISALSSSHNLWAEYAMYAALYLCSTTQGIDRLAWPDGKQAVEMEQKQLISFWMDTKDSQNQTVRMFMPNYFNTFQYVLRQEQSYCNLIGNMGKVLALLGRHKEADERFREAEEFSL